METDEMDKESQHQATVVAAFDSYLQQALMANQRRRADYFSSLSREQRELLPDYPALLAQVSALLVCTELDSSLLAPYRSTVNFRSMIYS